MYCSTCTTAERTKVQCTCPIHDARDPFQSPDQATFQYNSRLTGRSIRVIQLEPGNESDQIRCSLNTVLLDKAVYNTLSYTWGDATARKSIICDDQLLEVTMNLYDALWQFRKDGRVQPLWVDAVCINQSDMIEKTTQVRMMRDIYELSNLSITWLGKETETDACGFQMLQTISDLHGTVVLEDMGQTDFRQGPELGLPGVEDPVWAALCKILYRPYFSRVWIIQEIVTPRTCIVQCGDQVLPREVVLGVGIILEKYHFLKNMVSTQAPLSADSSTAMYYSARDLWVVKDQFDKQVNIKLLDLLQLTRMFKATDQRDKIFALVSLSSNFDTDFVSYEKTIAEIQVQVAITSMMDHDSWGPRLFSYVDATHQCKILPSWVPDWTIGGPVQVPLSGSFYAARSDPLNARNWKVEQGNKLKLPGKIFSGPAAIVQDTPYMVATPALQDFEKMFVHAKEMEEWEERCWELVVALNTTQERATGRHVHEAYWRALICNTERVGLEATTAMDNAYRAWVSHFGTCNEMVAIGRPLLAATKQASAEPRTGIMGFFDTVTTTWRYTYTMAKLQAKLTVITQQVKVAEPFAEAFKRYTSGRKFCTTLDGYMGWVPAATEAGDMFCYFEGYPLPFVIRPCNGEFHLIGDCYLHGLMHDHPEELDDVLVKPIVLV